MSRFMERRSLVERPYGFRSSFRDWVGETTKTPFEVAETALRHTVGGSVERAYGRTDFLGQRRALMERWAKRRVNTVLRAEQFGCFPTDGRVDGPRNLSEPLKELGIQFRNNDTHHLPISGNDRTAGVARLTTVNACIPVSRERQREVLEGLASGRRPRDEGTRMIDF